MGVVTGAAKGGAVCQLQRVAARTLASAASTGRCCACQLARKQKLSSFRVTLTRATWATVEKSLLVSYSRGTVQLTPTSGSPVARRLDVSSRRTRTAAAHA